MTQEEIIQGNKIIAEFMGGEIRRGKKHEVVMNDSVDGPFVSERVTNLKYHTSWEWQVPAWSKAIQQYDLPRKSVYKVRYSAAIEGNNPQLGFKILVELITELNN